MDSNAEIKRTIKNINVDSDSVTIDGKLLKEFIMDVVFDGIKKYVVNYNRETHQFYEPQQQCIIDDKEVARQCTQAQKAQIEEMQRRIAELNVNAYVNKPKYDLNNGE